MVRYLPFILILALTIYAFIDCLNAPEEEVRHLPKVIWVIIVLLFSTVGPIAWITTGRRRSDPAAYGADGPADSRGWVAPDDNPDFLKSLKSLNSEGAKEEGAEPRLEDWEADLRRREEELKPRENDGPQDTPPPAQP